MQAFIRAMSKFKYTFLADAITTVSPLVANIAAACAKYYIIQLCIQNQAFGDSLYRFSQKTVSETDSNTGLFLHNRFLIPDLAPKSETQRICLAFLVTIFKH